MIMGLGVDLVGVKRIAHWLDNQALCDRFFHPAELKLVQSRGMDAPRSLAARFAAKEAFIKALGSGFHGIQLRDIRVENDSFGKPHLVLEGGAREVFDNMGANRIHVSLSHEKNFAVAQVILENI